MNKEYVTYLQELLLKNGVEFKSQADFKQKFEKDKNIVQQQQQKELGEIKISLETNMH